MTSPVQRQPLNFAPFSGANSTRLRIASGWFIVSGILTLVLAGVVIVGLIVQPTAADEFRNHPWRLLIGLSIQVISALAWLWTGVLLNRRSRRGGILALVFLLLPLIAAAFSPRIDGYSLVISVIGLLIIATVWNELS
jgi:hypothetical protein